jgi:hypothetical protein
MSIAMAEGGAYISALIGLAIGVLLPLTAVKGLESFLEKLPEWLVQFTVGAVMMIAAALIILIHI